MPGKDNFIEPLIERAEQFSKTSFELLKLKSLDKTASVASSFSSRLLQATSFSLCMLTLTIALALWLGEVLGRSFYGFLAVAGFYGLISILLFVTHRQIKARVSNAIIRQILA